MTHSFPGRGSRTVAALLVILAVCILSLRADEPNAPAFGPSVRAEGLSPTTAPAVPPLPMAGEAEPLSAMILGVNELVEFYPDVLVDIVAAVGANTPVLALVDNPRQLRRAHRLLRSRGLATRNVWFVRTPMDTMWVRDYGPLFVRDGSGAAAVADAEYGTADNPGELRLRDNEVPKALARVLGLPVRPVPLCMDGGNLLTNGDGLYVSSTTLLEENFVRGYDASGVERVLRRHLGARRWVQVEPLEDEPTGHVDIFVTFPRPGVAVVAQLDATEDPENARRLDDTAARLIGQPTREGPMQVCRIPMPPREDGNWRTYTNVAYVNRTVLVPVYSGVNAGVQDAALALYRRLLPGWRVCGVRADALSPAAGYFHCITVGVPGFVDLATVRSRRRRLAARPHRAPPGRALPVRQ